MIPEANQEVGCQADALPTKEQSHIGIREHQGEHRGHEEVQVGEETPPVRVVFHIGHGVDVDQGTHKRNQQYESHRERIQEQIPGKLNRFISATGLKPGKHRS